MTNREYINSLSDEEFMEYLKIFNPLIFSNKKQILFDPTFCKMQFDNCKKYDNCKNCQVDWLKEEHSDKPVKITELVFVREFEKNKEEEEG